jgi:hypothetical protein
VLLLHVLLVLGGNVEGKGVGLLLDYQYDDSLVKSHILHCHTDATLARRGHQWQAILFVVDSICHGSVGVTTFEIFQWSCGDTMIYAMTKATWKILAMTTASLENPCDIIVWQQDYACDVQRRKATIICQQPTGTAQGDWSFFYFLFYVSVVPRDWSILVGSLSYHKAMGHFCRSNEKQHFILYCGGFNL